MRTDTKGDTNGELSDPNTMTRIIDNSIAMSAFILLCLWAPRTSADGNVWRLEVTPLLGYVTGGTLEDEFTNQELELDDSSAFGVNLNIRADHQATWEIQYARQETQTTAPDLSQIDVLIEKFEVGGTYEVNSEATRPYAAATIGFSHFEPQSAALRDDTYFSFSVGGGIKFFADRQTGFTLDARWVGAVFDDDTDLFCLSSNGLTCLIQTEAGLVSQFRLFAGFNVRF